MIHIVCLNPALDHLVVVDQLALNGVNRAISSLSTPGGKGINVARAVKTVGGTSQLHVFLGGSTGQMIAEALKKEGMDFHAWPILGENRITTVIHEEGLKRHTVINEPGSPVQLSVVGQFCRFLEESVATGDYVILSGSLAPGMRTDLYGHLIRQCFHKRVKTILDTSGDALAKAFHLKPFMVKPNIEEAEKALGFPIRTLSDKVRGVRVFLDRGVNLVVLSDGPRGLVVGWENAYYLVSWPGEVRGGEYGIGSGDSVVGGLVEKLSRGLPVLEAVCFGAACGLANTLAPGAGFFDLSVAGRFYRELTVTSVTGYERSDPDGCNH